MQRFKQCFPPEVITDGGIPMNIPVEYIFTVYWKNTDKVKGADSYMNMVYTLTYVDQINPELKVSQNPIDVRTTVTFNATESKFASTGDNKGIVYKWICPDIFQGFCDEWDGSPVMEITPQAFNTFGGIENRDYDFTIETFSINIGDRPELEEQIFKKKVTVRWANI